MGAQKDRIRYIIYFNLRLICKIIVFNNSDDKETIYFDVLGGYITNRISDINVPSGYNEINKNIKIGDIITINDNEFRLLNINNDNSIEVVSVDNYVDDSLKLNGAYGYNNAVSLLNNYAGSRFYEEKALIIRSVNLEDIERFTNDKVVSYNESKIYYNSSENIFYPMLFAFEKNTLIDNIPNSRVINRSESISMSDSFLNCLSFSKCFAKISFKSLIFLLAAEETSCFSLIAMAELHIIGEVIAIAHNIEIIFLKTFPLIFKTQIHSLLKTQFPLIILIKITLIF